jgi:hypothetical protein
MPLGDGAVGVAKQLSNDASGRLAGSLGEPLEALASSRSTPTSTISFASGCLRGARRI